ncbi:MAG TPA: tetratricopeptide repeat protein, partial [Burkholderiaceae bacterium]|nr:tetratricopeptide repeat protein [Burkholderiaceae bacterium]
LGPAFKTYLTLAQQTRDPRLARRAAEIGISARSYDQAVEAAQLWRELSPQNPRALQTLEALLLASGRLEQVEPLLAQRLQAARERDALNDAYAQLQRALQRAPDRSAAWRLMQRLSAPDLEHVHVRLTRAAIAGAADAREDAAAEARAALQLAPTDEDAAVAAARHLHRLPQSGDAARKILEEFLQRSPGATEARFTYGRLLLADDKLPEAQAQFERALADDPTNAAALFSLAQLAHRTERPEIAQRYLQRYLELPPSVPRDDNLAHLFLAQLAEDAGRVDEAIEHLERVQRGDQVTSATIKRALLLGRSHRIEQARTLLQQARVTSVQERVQLIAAEAQVLREAQRYQDAFDVLERALERMPNNPELLYDHGMAAERLDRIEVMEKSLRRLIELRPDHAHAYNALGYTLADRNLRLPEARQLIEKALELAPDDAHIIDSMGWVLYRQGEYARALEYLRRAYALRPDAEIAAHLGEVLWASGQYEEAKKLWREARGREPNNETLNGTLARLNVAL